MDKHVMKLFIWFAIFCFAGCVPSRSSLTRGVTSTQPPVPREFRAAWVASVANINWPSKAGLPVSTQKMEVIALLDLLHQHHYNAVILQVRPQCDALYQSDLEPWSYYLTGRQGQAPDPFYDPLEFWTEEAHKRGLELHAWLNPYRAHHTSGGAITETSIVKQRPDLVRMLKNGFWWLDPSQKATQDHSYEVTLDIVRRYDIDGIHFDDYFYPYPSYNENEEFPDEESYLSYLRSGGKLSREDWRRDQVNTFIKRLYRGIKKEKRYVKFGISPFGIWRPGHPEGIQGFDQYDELFADARLWLNKGWLDYFAPQLYWPIRQIPQSFPMLLHWWQQENLKSRHLWPGINLSKRPGIKTADELINQVMISRGLLPESPGSVHWSIGPLTIQEDSLAFGLLEGPFQKKALVPASFWLSHKQPVISTLTAAQADGKTILNLTSKSEFKQIIVRHKNGDRWQYDIISCEQGRCDVSDLITKFQPSGILVSLLDRYQNESKAMPLRLGGR